MKMTELLMVLGEALEAYKRTNNELAFLGVLSSNGFRIVPIDPKEVEEAQRADDHYTEMWNQALLKQDTATAEPSSDA